MKNKLHVKKTIIILLVLAIVVSCSSIHKFNVSEIEQGKWLKHADKSHTGQYFAVFSKNQKPKKDIWKVLFQDETDIYFGKVERKNLFSKTKIVEKWNFYKITLDEIKIDIPFYKTNNINHLLTNKIEEYLKEKGRAVRIDIIHGSTILRNEETQYQLELLYDWFHFERGKQQSKALVIMDKNLKILDMFYLYD